MGIIDVGRYKTDPSELAPPAMVIDSAPEEDTETLKNAFIYAIEQLINDGTLTRLTIAELMNEIEIYADLQQWRNHPNNDKRAFAKAILETAQRFSDLQAIESNAFMDAKNTCRGSGQNPTQVRQQQRFSLKSLLGKLLHT